MSTSLTAFSSSGTARYHAVDIFKTRFITLIMVPRCFSFSLSIKPRFLSLRNAALRHNGIRDFPKQHGALPGNETPHNDNVTFGRTIIDLLIVRRCARDIGRTIRTKIGFQTTAAVRLANFSDQEPSKTIIHVHSRVRRFHAVHILLLAFYFQLFN